MNVQLRSDEIDDAQAYESMICVICCRVHFVQRSTGKVLGEHMLPPSRLRLPDWA